MQRSLEDQGRRADDDELEILLDQAPAPRRSTRPSTSNLASSTRNEAAAVGRRSSTQAAPKSPSPPPISEEDRKWDEWWKAEDKAHKGEEMCAPLLAVLAQRRPLILATFRSVVEYPINQPGGVSLPWADVKRLKPGEFLNDTLIEFGLKCVRSWTRILSAVVDAPLGQVRHAGGRQGRRGPSGRRKAGAEDSPLQLVLLLPALDAQGQEA